MMPVVAIGQRRRVERQAGRRIEEVVARAQDQRDVAVHLGELDDLGLLGVDRQGDDLLLAGEGRAGLAGRRLLGPRPCGLGGRWREQRAEDLHALEEQLDARAVDAGDDREGVVCRVRRDDRELVGR